MGVARLAWNEKVQLRVAVTSNILAQLKSIKVSGLSPALTAYLQDLRDEEIETSMKDRHSRLCIYALCKLRLDVQYRCVTDLYLHASSIIYDRHNTGPSHCRSAVLD